MTTNATPTSALQSTPGLENLSVNSENLPQMKQSVLQ